jgi:hypothetical protein
MQISDSIGQDGFEKVFIETVMDDTDNKRKVKAKVPFQDNENELKNKVKMRKIIRKTYHDIDKANLVSGIYYFGNAMSSQMQDN